MSNFRLWHLDQQTRQVGHRQRQSAGLWNDSASRHIQGRYLRPHEQEADELLHDLKDQQQDLENVAVSVQDAQVHYHDAQVAGEEVASEISRAEYAVSMTHDSIQRALTFEARAARLQEQSERLAQEANAVCDGCVGEHGQVRVDITYTRLERSAFSPPVGSVPSRITRA